MDLDKVRLLNKKQLLEKLEQNGLNLLANILSDKDINGEKLLDLTEFETIKWRLPLSQKKLLFNGIDELKRSPSKILKSPTSSKVKYGVPKPQPPKPPRIQQKEPPPLKTKPKISNFPEDQNRTAFKQKLGTLFNGSSEIKPISTPRPPELSASFNEIPTPPRFRKFDGTQQGAAAGFDNQVSPSDGFPIHPRLKKSDSVQKKATYPNPPALGGPVNYSDEIPTPRFKKIDDNRHKASYPDPSNDQVAAPRDVDSKTKLPLPTPIESKITSRATSPLGASDAKAKRELPLPVEPQRSNHATTLSRPKVVESDKTRTMENKPKPALPPPMETQSKIPTRSSNAIGSKLNLPVPSSVEPQSAQRKPALLPSKKWGVTPTPPKQKLLQSVGDDTYVDMTKQNDINYGYLSPIEIAVSRSSSPLVPPFLPPRNASPNLQSHGSDEEEPTYHDPDEVYEQAPKLNSFDDPPNIPSVIIRNPSPLSTRAVDISKIHMEIKSRNEDKQGNGFLKKLFKIKGKPVYENFEIERKMEHRISVSDKIQPRPLPPVPMQDAPPKRGEIPIGDPVGYIELTLQPPEAEELYANYDEKGAQILVEGGEANYSNTLELKSRPQHFPSTIYPKNIMSQQSPDDLAAKLAKDLKARAWHKKEQSDDTDGSEFEMDPEEDEDFSEQTYSNLPIENSKALASKSPSKIITSIGNNLIEQQKQVKGTATNRSKQQIFPVGNSNVNGELGDEIYENLQDSASSIWQARSLPLPPEQINESDTAKNRNRGGLNYTSVQFSPVEKKIIIEAEKEEDSADQIYGNIDAEKSHPEKSRDNSIFNISNEPYYRHTDRKGAKQLLRTLGNGAFLFRPSEKHFLVLSAKHNGKFYNFGIERSQNGKIRLTADTNSDVPEFSSLKEFVEYFSKEALTFQEETSLAEIYLSPVLPHDVF